MRKKYIYCVLIGFVVTISATAQKKDQSQQLTHKKIYNSIQEADTTIAERFNLNEVVITATRSPKKLSQSPVITQVITAQQIESRGLSDIKNLLEQEIPGLVFNQVGFGTSINLQGLGGKHILFLIDGERMAGETGDNVDYNRFDLNNVERVEIVQGASSALYGSQAMGGVINIITKKTSHKFHANAAIKWAQPYECNYRQIDKDDIQHFFKKSVDRHNLNTDITVGGKWSKWTAQSAFSLKSADAYRLFDTDSVIKHFGQYGITIHSPLKTIPTNVSGFASHSFTQSVAYVANHRLTFSAKGNFYAMSKFDLVPDNKHEYNTDLSSTLGATYRIGEHSDLQVSLYGDSYSKNNRLELLDGKTELIYRHRILQPRVLYAVRLSEKHYLNTGAEYLDESLYADRFTTNVYETRSQQALSAFAQDEWRMSSQFSVTAGLRADHNSAYGFNLSPKIAVFYRVFPFTFRFNYASGYRSPSLKELYMNWDHLGMFMIYGNADLRPEYNHYASLSAEFVSQRMYAVATGYVNRFSDKIEGIWSNNQTELHYRNTGKTTLAGINGNIRYNPFGELFLHVSANYLHPRQSNGVRLNTQSTFSGTARAEYALKLAPRHRITFNLSGTLAGKKKYSVLETIEVNGTDTDAYYVVRVPAYSLWNASVTYWLAKRARFTLGMDNVLNYRAPIINFNSYTGAGRHLFVVLAMQL